MHGGAGVRNFIVNWTLASLGGYRIGILGAFTGGSTVISGMEQTAGSTGVGGAKGASGFAGFSNGIAFGHANCFFCGAKGCGKEGSREGASCAAPGMLRSNAAIGILICIAVPPRFYPTANPQQRPGVERSKLVSHARLPLVRAFCGGTHIMSGILTATTIQSRMTTLPVVTGGS
jgi:hypothetical protein